MEKKEREQLKERFMNLVVDDKREKITVKDLTATAMMIRNSPPDYSVLLNFIEQELSKAREEGYQDCIDDIWEEARALRGWTEHDGSISATDIEAGLQEAYLNIEESRQEVS